MDGFVAGAALLAAGRFDAARVAFARADDPDRVAGLVVAAAAFAGAGGDETAARDRAARARNLLRDDRPVETGPLRAALTDPDPDSPPRLRVDGDRVDPEALSPGPLGRAAVAVAATTGADEAVVADAARYVRADADEGRGRFGTLLTDIVVGRESGLAYGRLESLVARRRARERDVDGLF
ncbi:MAG: hypothetical protein ABEJ34_01955 [Haloferacaceae archaeon]